jgi:hypothetical protein
MNLTIAPLIIGIVGGILMMFLGYLANKEDEKENKN